MLICWPDMKDGKENYHLLKASGRVIKEDSGSVVILKRHRNSTGEPS